MKKRRFTELSRDICFAAVVIAVMLLMQACKSSEGQNKAAVSTVVSQENQQAQGQQAPERQVRAPPANFEVMLAEAKPLCEQYKTATYAVKCEDALSKALLDSPGAVQKVTLGEELVPESSGNRVLKEMWLFEIKLQNPAVFLGKEANLIVVGIGTSKDTGIKRRPLP